MAVTINGSGQVPVQVVQTVKADTFSLTGTTFTDVTGLSVSITPINSSNKILIMVNGVTGYSSYLCRMRLMRNSTPIALGNAAGNRTQGTLTASATSSSDQYQMIPFSINFVDSPSTTSATTYKLQIASYDGGNTVFINRSSAWQDFANYDGTMITTITVMEISG